MCERSRARTGRFLAVSSRNCSPEPVRPRTASQSCGESSSRTALSMRKASVSVGTPASNSSLMYCETSSSSPAKRSNAPSRSGCWRSAITARRSATAQPSVRSWASWTWAGESASPPAARSVSVSSRGHRQLRRAEVEQRVATTQARERERGRRPRAEDKSHTGGLAGHEARQDVQRVGRINQVHVIEDHHGPRIQLRQAVDGSLQ